MKIVACTLVVAVHALSAESGTMRQVFDELTQFGVQLPLVKYPDEHFTAITNCMKTAGSTLYPAASDAAWTGWTQFGINGGQPGDPWSLNNSAPWMEYDPRDLKHDGHGIPIIEPCNTVSNLAYYRIIPDMCANRDKLVMSDDYANAIIQGFATLGMGSSFMHGSRTALGGDFDNIPISVIAYQYFQLMTGTLKPGANGSASVLHELSDAPRAYNSRVLATKLHTIPLEFELNDWRSALRALDRPQYFFTFGAIVVNALTLIAPPAISDKLIPPLMSAFDLSADVQAFLVETFVPTIREAMAEIRLTIAEKGKLVSKFLGTIIKLLYAFAFQEQTFVYDAIYSPTWNLFGALLIPAINSLSNGLTGYPHPDNSIQKGEAIYGGQAYCKVKATAPHAKWHEVSANGLMDLGYMADAVHAILRDAATSADGGERSTASDVILTTDVIDAWAAELQAQPWSEGYVVTQAFALVVKKIVSDMDRCGSGKADGSITWDELACYIAGIDSGSGFIQKLFEDINAHYKPALSLVHNTPYAHPIFV